MIKYNMKEVSEYYGISYNKLKHLNAGNLEGQRVVSLLLLSYFVEKVEITIEDLIHLKHFYKTKKGVREDIKITKVLEEVNEEYWNVDFESLKLAKELYMLDLSKEDIRAIEQIKQEA